jgi:RNA polymerase sigma-70 factor (ECF subfamily)
MCDRRTVAEDVVQEAFLSLWRSAASYDPVRGSVRTWVLGIVHHRAIDALRRGVVYDRGQISDEGIEEHLEAVERTEQEVDRRDEAREIRAVLEGLPPEQSRVIELAYYGGLTHSEIAAMLETPVGTIKGRMRLGLQKMRSQLRSEDPRGRARPRPPRQRGAAQGGFAPGAGGGGHARPAGRPHL